MDEARCQSERDTFATLLALVQEPWRAVAPRVEASSPKILSKVLDLALDAGVGPLVAARLLDGYHLEPRTEETALKLRQASLLRHYASRRQLHLVMDPFSKAGIEAVAFKGPLLAELAYEDPSLRSSVDLDIYVPRGHLAAALRAVEPLGYRPCTCSDEIALSGGVELRANDARFPLDLHVALAKPLLVRCPPTPARESLVMVGGVKTFDPAWTIALAAVHLHQDVFEFSRVLDLAALLARAPEGLPKALRVARAFGVSGVLRLGVLLARSLGVRAGPGFAEVAPTTFLQRAVARRVDVHSLLRRPAWLDTDELRGRAGGLLVSWALLDNPLEGLHGAARLLFPPREYTARRGGVVGRLWKITHALLRGQS